MSNIISATQARKDFFNILNQVAYGNQVFYISKAGSPKLIKLESTSPSSVHLSKLAGKLTKSDAQEIKKTIKTARSYPHRPGESFD